MILRLYYLLRRLAASARRNSSAAAMDRHRSDFYAQAWTEAAEAAGARITPAGSGFSRIALGRRAIIVNTNLNPLDSQAATALSDDKPASYALLSGAGLPTPEHVVLRLGDTRAAVDFLMSGPRPVVVKPAAGTGGGVGVSTNITTASELRHAMAWAGAYCNQILIERNVEGETYRLLYLDGRLLDCVLRRSPQLAGDGVSTIAALAAKENALRVAEGVTRSQALLGVDADMKLTLAAQGLRLGSVPEKERRFTIKRVVNENAWAENETASICGALESEGRQIADLFGLRLVGVDVITPDPQRPLAAAGGAVIDVNGAPGFYYHYHKKGGRCALAGQILKGAFEYA